MIDLDRDRVGRVRRFLDAITEEQEFDLLHRVVTQSYKVDFARHDIARAIGAISFLLVGEPTDFDQVYDPAAGLAIAERIFRDTAHKPDRASVSLLLDHARAALTAEPRKTQRGYIDLEGNHLVLFGARALFTGILRSMLTPYRPEGEIRTYDVATFADMALWVRPEVAKTAVAGRRHWQDWARGW